MDDLKLLVTAFGGAEAHQVALKEKSEQLKVLADLALKLLNDRCPVCGQSYDKKATRLRLQSFAKGESGDAKAAREPDKLTELLAALAAKEKETATSELALGSAEQVVNQRQKSEEVLTKRLNDLNVIANDATSRDIALAKTISEADALTDRAAELQRIGESLALGFGAIFGRGGNRRTSS